MASALVSATLAACGGGARQGAQEPSGHFDVQVPTASFPASQSLSQHVHMVIAVRNAGAKTIPDVAVTITDANYNTSAQPFGERISMPNLAYPSRPVWIVDEAPSLKGCQYSCGAGGPGGAVNTASNTWALGALAPGHTVTFRWTVTAVKSGTHVVHYRVAASLTGRALAVLAGGQRPEGTFSVTIHTAPSQAYVNNHGQVVTTPTH